MLGQWKDTSGLIAVIDGDEGVKECQPKCTISFYLKGRSGDRSSNKGFRISRAGIRVRLELGLGLG